ncbi:pentatricopeptide repeat-containing protein At3g12770-like [Arachis stenosperma]|uniref:pentatricopeptide repeat-containing protein At3g12770-like n=1 Tax=Arachis stenosperma TaxID=217475 RepID=UPI0025AD014D|nr:pentatricopeptide repeat-containing protein At3g12770-like [Arachis stenosperma]
MYKLVGQNTALEFNIATFSYAWFVPLSYIHLTHAIAKPMIPSKLIHNASRHLQYASFNQSPPSIFFRFSSLLHQFSNTLFHVKSIHAQIIINGVYNESFLVVKLIKAYSGLGFFGIARKVFDQCSHPETFLCNAMMAGYLRNQQCKEVPILFKMMGSCHIDINSYTCMFALKACTSLLDFQMGMEVVRDAVAEGLHLHPNVGSSVINFWVKFGKLGDARAVFDEMPERDVVCWNSMIGGYVQWQCFTEAIRMFLEMINCGIRPSRVTMASLLKVCGESGLRKFGRCLHSCVLVCGMGNDVFVLTSLVDMYSKIGETNSASLVFNSMCSRTLVSWNAMISGYVQNGMVHESFALFSRLVQIGAGFDSGTLVSLIQGCCLTSNLRSGKSIHSYIIRKGFEPNLVLSTAIVDMYCKCGATKQAVTVFRRMDIRNVITWTALLVGLSQNGYAEDALKLFCQMQEENVAANSVTLVSLVHCCTHLGSLKKGRSIHAHFIRHGYTPDAINISALIDMYAKCGKIHSAKKLFNNGFPFKDSILCNSMIMGYGMHGYGHQALGVFGRMIEEGVKPNQTTFISLLTACSHSGLVEEGKTLFHSMERDHGIKPSDKHYACLVDLLSRAGHLEEADTLVKQMPFEPSTDVLEALLSGCRTHKNINMGIQMADRLLSLNDLNSGIYVMLSNIYAEARRWDAVNHIRGLMRTRGLKKTPAYSLIEVGNELHTFFAGDDSHPKWEDIHQLLENLRIEVEACGYVPDTSCVLRDVNEEMKVKLLWGHSERLAIAFGLLSTPYGSLIRITKNLRVCVDCHNVTKYISRIVKREIIVRDANRFHHFVNGQCSCNDYW